MASNFATLISNTGIAKGENLMQFVTSIKYTAQVAKMVNNITFLYDPNWSYGAYEQATLPCCFYFVQKWEEIGEAEINSKPMMFYNSRSAKGTQRNGAVLDVVADNIINQPKMYRADVLVPFTPDACLKQYQLDTDTLVNTYAFADSGDKSNNTLAVTNRFIANATGLLRLPFTPDACLKQYQLDTDTLVNTYAFAVSGDKSNNTLAVTNRFIANATGQLRLLFSALSVDLSAPSIANLILAQNDINKVSLDSMRESRGILKMKMWNGWRFKYVMLKNVDLTKSGEYDGFYEGSITVQETPIVNVYQKDQISSVERKGKSLLEKTIGTGIKNAFDKMTGAMKKAEGVS